MNVSTPHRSGAEHEVARINNRAGIDLERQLFFILEQVAEAIEGLQFTPHIAPSTGDIKTVIVAGLQTRHHTIAPNFAIAIQANRIQLDIGVHRGQNQCLTRFEHGDFAGFHRINSGPAGRGPAQAGE